jgi:hypothetical protein
MLMKNEGVKQIIEDNKGNIWFATADGIARYSGDGTLRTFDEVEGLKTKDVNSIAQAINGDIYTILSIEYKYKIDEFKRQKLYSNYSSVTQQSDDSFIINSVNCTVKHNVFYDLTTREIKFNFYISETDEEDLTFKLKDVSGNYTNLIPLYIRKTLSKTQTPLQTDLSTLFSSVFSDTNNSRTITWINSNIRNNLGVLDENLNIKLGIQLLNNCVKNSIFPTNYFSDDIIICSSYNDLVENDHLKLNDIHSFD